MSGPEALIEARGLVKQFGSFTAVDGIDFTVARGESFGFLGPNGAGESSTMRMIAGVSRRSGASCACWAWTPTGTVPASGPGSGWYPRRTPGTSS